MEVVGVGEQKFKFERFSEKVEVFRERNIGFVILNKNI